MHDYLRAAENFQTAVTPCMLRKSPFKSCSLTRLLWGLSCSAYCQVITDPLTNRSKGYGFVRFGSEGERDRALGDMIGHLISNRPIRVSIATAKKNMPGAPAAMPMSATNPHPSDHDPTNTTLFIGGLSASVTEEDLSSLFGRFGDMIYVKVPPGKGCGFVQYVHRPVAEVAMSTMQAQVCCRLIQL